jgi:hypothetical protein
MKKNFLSIMTMLLTATVVNAQVEVTSYRGAFAPAPTRMWTESWTNFDPQNASYGATNVNVSGTISANTTWTRNNVYLLQGLVYIDTLVTLTIEPGTVIRGDFNTANSSLIVRRGAKLNAEGTVCNPIVFTSNRAAGSRALADWGGVILLGRARNNQNNNVVIEGLTPTEFRNYHGGTDDNDNSGILKYVRIEYGGFVFAPNNEINGLTMGSIGRNTLIDYVQVSFTNDDAYEWFGGTVNCKHLVAYRNLDDDFDTDFGYSGTVQFALGVRDPAISDNPTVSTSEGWESDNDPVGTNQALSPKTSAAFYNVTQIGGFRCASNANGSGAAPTASGFRRGARLRRNTDLKIFNSILMNNRRGLLFDGALALANVDQDSLRFRNNIIAADFTTNYTSPSGNGVALAYDDAATRAKATNTIYANDSINTCSLLTNAWDFINPDYRPNTAGDGALVTNPANLSTGADLALGIDIDNALFTPNPGTGPGFAYDFVTNVFENGGGSTGGIIVIIIVIPSGWDITVDADNNSDVFGGTTNENSKWNFSIAGGNITITSKDGTIIPKNGQAVLGFRATRKSTTSTGTSQSLGATISGGGDTTPANNATVLSLGTSN